MWVQVLRPITVDISGDSRHFYPGDWVDIGKVLARDLLKEGAICIPGSAGATALPEIQPSGVEVIGPEMPILPSGVALATRICPFPELRGQKIIWVEPGISLSDEMIAVGLGLLDTWELAIPLLDYDFLAKDAMPDAERDATAAVLPDMRVPLYDTRLMFLRKCEATARLLERWRRELGINRNLAFLRVLYRNPMLVLALPVTWSGKNVI